jgi:transglutaminase-like putative cysteine protease
MNYLSSMVSLLLLVLQLTSCTVAKDASNEIETKVTQLTEAERMRRIAIDFNKNRTQIKTEIERFIPNVTDRQILDWEKKQQLECKIIKGEKRYFRNAVPNLFRLDNEAKAIKEKIKPSRKSGHEIANAQDIPEVVKKALKTRQILQQPTRMRFTYTLTVPANKVPHGKVIRCWLPYPRRDINRQRDIQLLKVNNKEYIISPPDAVHSSLYMEKKAVKDQPTVFSEVVEFSTSAFYYPLSEKDIKPYQKETELYKKFVAERPPHIVFTDTLKELAKLIVGKEKRPLYQARKLYEWIDKNYPWGSAREYSTIPCIPMYVIQNGHGDCGQVSLLFITMARYLGIPTSFQSGFMLHPNGTNIHDWGRIYFEGIGWVPMDQSFGLFSEGKNEDEVYFFTHGIDAYRMIVNQGYSGDFVPAKNFSRSETVDFQRGEVEWEEGNLYFNEWDWDFQVEYLTKK